MIDGREGARRTGRATLVERAILVWSKALIYNSAMAQLQFAGAAEEFACVARFGTGPGRLAVRGLRFGACGSVRGQRARLHEHRPVGPGPRRSPILAFARAARTNRAVSPWAPAMSRGSGGAIHRRLRSLALRHRRSHRSRTAHSRRVRPRRRDVVPGLRRCPRRAATARTDRSS